MRVTVTGGAGFVGSHIATNLVAMKALAKERHVPGPWAVRVVDDLSTGFRENLPDGVDWHCVDAGAADYSQCDAIVHAAAYPDVSQNWKHARERDRQWTTNADLTRRVLDRAPEGAFFVLLSTCSVYGAGGEVDEHSPTWASSPYAASKLAAEALVDAYTYAGRVRGTILRLVNVVGRRYKHGHLADFVAQAKQGRIHALDDGRKRKSFVHAGDVAEEVCRELTMGSGRPGRHEATRVNVTSETLWSWRDSVEVMRTMHDAGLKITHEDRAGGWIGDPDELKVSTCRAYGKRSIIAGVREALEDLGWGPQ